MPIKILVLVWVVGLALVAFEQRAMFQRARSDLPRAQAHMRARRTAEMLRQRDSVMAFERAPVTVTASGDSVRAIAYTALEATSVGSPSALFAIMFAAWVFKIPLALLVFTIAWLVARFRPSTGTSPSAPFASPPA